MNYWGIATSIEGRSGRIARLGYLATRELSGGSCGCSVGASHSWWKPCEKHKYWLHRLLCRWAIRQYRQRAARGSRMSPDDLREI